MRLSRAIALALSLIGASSAVDVLRRRHQWESKFQNIALCVDYDSIYSASVRAGVPLDGVFDQLALHGATHVSLPELTLDRLMRTGELNRGAPPEYPTEGAPVGHWNFLVGAAALVKTLAAELNARLPFINAHVENDTVLTFAGELGILSEIGLGFDGAMAARIQHYGLDVVPRPVSYAWPDDALIRMTLAQAAVYGNLVAFDTNMILGHELHLQTTMETMAREGLSFVYFAESRHQKGDWFLGKRLAPTVILGHRLTAADMIPLDYVSASKLWALLARERGIRLCYLDFFKTLHAADPLEGLLYVREVRRALEADGFMVAAKGHAGQGGPRPTRRELSLAGLAAAAISSAALTDALKLPEYLAVSAVGLASVGAVSLPYLERPRNALELEFPPAYASKLVALGAAMAPAIGGGDSLIDWAAGLIFSTAAAAVVGAATSGPDYYLRIEEFRGFNIDWAIPLGAALGTWPDQKARWAGLTGLLLTWWLCQTRGIDLLSIFDLAHAEAHVHHLSAATRTVGDIQLALGPRPARKLAGVGIFANALRLSLRAAGHDEVAFIVGAVAVCANAAALSSWRRPERALRITGRDWVISMAGGVAMGAIELTIAAITARSGGSHR
jgi:hypothetical protein